MVDKKVLQEWATASEVNNKEFEIYRSNNRMVWESIALIDGHGTTYDAIEYQYVDESPVFGINYYLLKQSDFNGEIKYSDVISIEIEGNEHFIGEFYPNPSQSDLLSLYYYSIKDEVINVSAFDLTGKTFINQNYSVIEGANNLRFDYSDFGKGLYAVKIKNDKGQTSRKLIIQ